MRAIPDDILIILQRLLPRKAPATSFVAEIENGNVFVYRVAWDVFQIAVFQTIKGERIIKDYTKQTLDAAEFLGQLGMRAESVSI